MSSSYTALTHCTLPCVNVKLFVEKASMRGGSKAKNAEASMESMELFQQLLLKKESGRFCLFRRIVSSAKLSSLHFEYPDVLFVSFKPNSNITWEII